MKWEKKYKQKSLVKELCEITQALISKIKLDIILIR